jgi:Recombination endonuclease VII
MSRYRTPKQRRVYAQRSRLSKYGLTPADYERMVAERQGRCDGCSGTNGGRSLVVDHCHKSGKVRGLLCYSCNQALSLIQDSAETLLRLAEYLGRV